MHTSVLSSRGSKLFTAFVRSQAMLCAAAAVLALSGSSGAADDAASSNVIEFRTVVNNDQGVVRCGLFRQKGWLKDPIQGATAKIQGKSAVCIFTRVPSGVYGISGFHDENSNGKLDTNVIGMPTEDYCASRDARGTLGPPSFDDAKFKYSGGTKRLEARMK